MMHLLHGTDTPATFILAILTLFLALTSSASPIAYSEATLGAIDRLRAHDVSEVFDFNLTLFTRVHPVSPSPNTS